nr:hypothetical protein [Tanacetum cinerariifolium]
MLVIKIFSERTKVFRERKKCEKIRAKRDCKMVVKEILNGLLEEVKKLEWWFEQDIDDEVEEDEEGKKGHGSNFGAAAGEDAFENKQYKPEDIQELFHELFNDVQNIHEELAEYINTPGWNRPAFYTNGDDDDEDCTIAITPDFLITDSLIMRDEHLDTIPEKESDKFIKFSVENLVPNPSEFEDECECDVPDCDDSQTTKFSTFSNPLFDDSTSSDDESSHEEVIHEMSFKTYSNPLFDIDEEIVSSEFNPIHNEDLDSTPKNERFDAKSCLFESLLNHDALMDSSLKIDSLLAEFAGELFFLKSLPPGIDEANCDPEEVIYLVERLLYDNSSPRP